VFDIRSSLASVRKRFVDTFSSRSNTSGNLGTATDGSRWTAINGIIQVISGKARATSTPTSSSAGSDYPLAVVDMPTENNTIKIKNTENGASAAIWVQSSTDWWMIGVESVFNVIPGPTTYTSGSSNYTATTPNYTASIITYTASTPTYTIGPTTYTSGPTGYSSGGLEYSSAISAYSEGPTTYTDGGSTWTSTTPYTTSQNYTSSLLYTTSVPYTTATSNFLSSTAYNAGATPYTSNKTYNAAAATYNSTPGNIFQDGAFYNRTVNYTRSGSTANARFTSSASFTVAKFYARNASTFTSVIPSWTSAATYNAGAVPYTSNNYWATSTNYTSGAPNYTSDQGTWNSATSYTSATFYTKFDAYTSGLPTYTSALSYTEATPYTSAIDYSGSTAYSSTLSYTQGDQVYSSSSLYTSATPYTSQIQPDTYVTQSILKIRKSVSDAIFTMSSAIVSTSQTIKSILINTDGEVITAKAYSDANLVNQIGEDLVYTATGAVITTMYGISVSPSAYEQSDIIGSEVTIERS
jgi:hypothetical protein